MKKKKKDEQNNCSSYTFNREIKRYNLTNNKYEKEVKNAKDKN